ncbi:MAG: thioredoxin domain-containing protein [Polyangiaceae bacterium]|nr:thioredoxin domain-containing protein [Polyangiaceae bacterium]
MSTAIATREDEWELEALVASFASGEEPPPDATHWAPDVGPCVTVVLFASYASPFAAAAERAVTGALGGIARARLVRRHFVDPRRRVAALLGAELAEAARAQGRFLAAHEALLARGGALEGLSVERFASDVGLCAAEVVRELASHRPRLRVARDQWHARRLGVLFAPTCLLDGREYEGDWREVEVEGRVRDRLAELDATHDFRRHPTLPCAPTSMRVPRP